MSESKTPIANVFGSKVLRSEQKRSDKKNLIWDSEPSFNVSENDCDNSLEKLMAKHTKSAFEKYDDSENYDLKENIKDCLRKYEQSPRMPSCMSPLSYWSHKEKETIKPWIKAKALLAKYYLTVVNVWGKRFKLPQLTHATFLTIDHSCKIFF